MMREIKTIDLLEFRGNKSRLFTGRPQGEDARKSLKLDSLEKDVDEIVLQIPKDTRSFNPSFFLGLLYESIENLGFELFNKKYKFKHQDEKSPFKSIIDKNIQDALRHALNSLKDAKGLKGYFD